MFHNFFTKYLQERSPVWQIRCLQYTLQDPDLTFNLIGSGSKFESIKKQLFCVCKSEVPTIKLFFISIPGSLSRLQNHGLLSKCLLSLTFNTVHYSYCEAFSLIGRIRGCENIWIIFIWDINYFELLFDLNNFLLR